MFVQIGCKTMSIVLKELASPSLRLFGFTVSVGVRPFLICTKQNNSDFLTRKDDLEYFMTLFVPTMALYSHYGFVE